MFHKTQAEIMRNWHIGLDSSANAVCDKNLESTLDSKLDSNGNMGSNLESNTSLKPLCSFLCVTYNHAPYIEQCLQGFLEQETTFPFEIIIHDDCSTDGTTEIIREYEKAYPLIIKALYEEENQYSKGANGTPFWANMHKMAAKYIAICEGDDYWDDKEKIQKQVSFLESNPSFVVCYHRCHSFDKSGIVAMDDGSAYKDVSGSALQKLELIMPTRTVCYRNVVDYLEPNLLHYYRKVVNGDTFLWALLGRYGGAKYLDSINPAYYRLHSGGVWSALDSKTHFRVHTISFYYISEYFSSVGNYEVASFFLRLSMQNLCYASDTSLTQDDMEVAIKALYNKRGGGGGGQATYGWLPFHFHQTAVTAYIPSHSFPHFFVSGEIENMEKRSENTNLAIHIQKHSLAMLSEAV